MSVLIVRGLIRKETTFNGEMEEYVSDDDLISLFTVLDLPLLQQIHTIVFGTEIPDYIFDDVTLESDHGLIVKETITENELHFHNSYDGTFGQAQPRFYYHIDRNNVQINLEIRHPYTQMYNVTAFSHHFQVAECVKTTIDQTSMDMVFRNSILHDPIRVHEIACRLLSHSIFEDTRIKFWDGIHKNLTGLTHTYRLGNDTTNNDLLNYLFLVDNRYKKKELNDHLINKLIRICFGYLHVEFIGDAHHPNIYSVKFE